MSIKLVEGQRSQTVSYGLAQYLQDLDVCDASLGTGDKAIVSNFRKIGFVNYQGQQVEIEPKVGVQNLLWLMDPKLRSLETLTSDVALDRDAHWTYFITSMYLSQLGQALAKGPVHGYVEMSEWQKSIRGRILFSEMATTSKFGRAEIPVQFDEFSTDTLENRTLKTALEILLANPLVSQGHRGKLLRFREALADVNLLQTRRGLKAIKLEPHMAHYKAALSTADLIISSQAVSASSGRQFSKSFLIDMARLFEYFIEDRFRDLSRARRIDFLPQRGNQYLDDSALFRIRPDYLWVRDQRVVGLADAKYKLVLSKSEVPNSDINQLIAYCTRLGVSSGHLIYAQAPEFQTRITNTEINIFIHELRLDSDITALADQIEKIFETIVSGYALEPQFGR